MSLIIFFIIRQLTRLVGTLQAGLHPQGVGRGCKAAKAATTTHHGFAGTCLQLSPRGREGDCSLSHLWERVRERAGNSLEWNDHSASALPSIPSRKRVGRHSPLPPLAGEGWDGGGLALHTTFHGLQAIESRSPLVGHPKNRTLQPVQLRFLGACRTYPALCYNHTD